MKIVLDSNIFVSAFYWKGNPRKVFERVASGLDELYITDEILNEILDVMSRKKFNSNPKEIADYIRIIESFSIKLFTRNKIEKVSRDNNDDKILQCGIDGNVDFIITGDNDLLVLEKYRNVKIIGPKEYLEKFEGNKSVDGT
jgi:putative PIN family toxin of toxin-antitoxin system